jgi:hypothetical protein
MKRIGNQMVIVCSLKKIRIQREESIVEYI